VNLCLYLAAGQLFVVALVRRLREGAAELAGSVSALRSAHDGASALHAALSEGVSRAAARLEEGVLAAEPEQDALAQALAGELARARTLLPPELPLPTVSLGERLAALQQRLRSAGLWTATLVVVGSAIYVAWKGPRDLLVLNLPFAAIACGLSYLHLRRPRWGPVIVSTFLVVTCPFIAARNWEWFELSAALPPNAAAWTLTAVIATGVVGLPLGLAVLGMGTVWLAYGIASHPGLPALLPLATALASGATCWALDRLPRDLLRVLQRWQQEANEGIRRRRRLTATFFHDLANPLAVVQMLLSEERTAEDEARLRAMTRRIRLVVETALGGPGAPRALEAGALCGELEQLFRERLSSKEQRLRISGALTARLWACEPLLRESVLGNLLSNAIKFSPPGADIDLVVREEPGAVIFSVEDRGPGLPPDVHAAVAARSEAASRPGTAGEPGSGFGLMLARDYLESMGGALELADREGGGAAVRLRLPAAQSGAA
jgi:signal transduction histidine kinase